MSVAFPRRFSFVLRDARINIYYEYLRNTIFLSPNSTLDYNYSYTCYLFRNSTRGGRYGLAGPVIPGSSDGRDVYSAEESGSL